MEIVSKDLETFSKTNEIQNNFLKRYKDSDSYVILPRGIIRITDTAFTDNKRVKAIFIPETVRDIYDGHREEGMMEDEDDKFFGCFSGCIFLNEVKFSKEISLEKIPSYCFTNCYSLKKVAIPKGVKQIGMMAFYDCLSLTNVVLPETLESIQMYAFYNCTSMEYIIIPDNIKYIGKYAFSGLTSDQTIIFRCSEKQSLNFHADWKSGCDSRIIWNFKTQIEK